MLDTSKQSFNWTLITIADPKCLPGKSIFDVIQILLKAVNFKFVIIDDIIGARVSALVEKENTIMTVDSLLNIICNVVQFDWGDFFLFKEYPENWISSKKLTYPDIIIQTNTTVRAIDDGYIYIYTPCEKIVKIIEENYKIESIKIDSINNLDYPY